MAILYRTAALRESVTTMALAWPSSSMAALARKCSTMICTFCADVGRVQFDPPHQPFGGLALVDEQAVVCTASPGLAGFSAPPVTLVAIWKAVRRRCSCAAHRG